MRRIGIVGVRKILRERLAGVVNQQARFRRLQQLSDRPLPALTIRYARRFLKDYPYFGPGWILLAIALVELARYEEAEQALAKAIEHCPAKKLQIPFAHMGHLFRAGGDFDQAAEWYRKAINADPADASYRIYLGAVLAEQGRLHDAEEAHRAAINCTEGCIDEAYFNLGLVLRALDRFSEAADCFREAIRLDPAYAAARQALRDVERCIRWSRGRA
jgi:tetratricopeptide (TPR) repeat protein